MDWKIKEKRAERPLEIRNKYLGPFALRQHELSVSAYGKCNTNANITAISDARTTNLERM